MIKSGYGDETIEGVSVDLHQSNDDWEYRGKNLLIKWKWCQSPKQEPYWMI